MIFLSNKIDINSYTMIHNVFFEQILPYIDIRYTRIYLYCYYLASNIQNKANITNSDIANILNVNNEDMLCAFDYLEKCNLIRKHYIQNSTFDDYSIEILDIRQFDRQSEVSIEQEYLSDKNEKLKIMYEQIEEIVKVHLNANDIRKIDAVIKNNDLSYDVVVESFKFVYYNKKKASVFDALAVLKTWIKDGIYTTNDLDTNLFNINERYATYRKILKYFGEYRLATEPEKKMMDKWMDEYLFSIEVVEKAIDETLKIKSPNFKYLDSILTNWSEMYKSKVKMNTQNKDEHKIIRQEILDYLNIESIDNTQEKMLSFLYKNYDKDVILSAINYLRRESKKNVDIKQVYSLIVTEQEQNIKNETVISYGNITLKQMQDVFKEAKQEYKKTQITNSYNTKKQDKKQDDDELSGEELEKLILSKNDLSKF